MTNITNIVNDMSITPTEDIPEKKKHLVVKRY